jgi:DNA-binding MarR family transcriptional regulator
MPRWLDPREQEVWRSYLEVERLLADRLHRQLTADSRLSLQEYDILVWLSEVPGRSLRMSELADRLVFARSRLTHTVARLEKRGLVRRSACRQDGRGVLCELTATGFTALAGAAPGHVSAVRDALFDPLDAEDVEALGLALGKVRARLREL